ncbi:MAG: hypothetical protein IPK26_30285 [Planctomycetes bacterium]|nr:hypothetical protein [Planctomycetota bacterium]
MFIDYDGQAPAANAQPTILVDQLPTSSLVGSFLHFGFPNPTPVFLVPQVEFWVTNSTAIFLPEPALSGSLRRQLPALPPGPAQFSLQVICAMAIPISCSGTSLGFAGSPAITFEY